MDFLPYCNVERNQSTQKELAHKHVKLASPYRKEQGQWSDPAPFLWEETAPTLPPITQNARIALISLSLGGWIPPAQSISWKEQVVLIFQHIWKPLALRLVLVYPSSHRRPFVFHPRCPPAFRRFLLGQTERWAQFRSAGPPFNILISAYTPLTLLLSRFLLSNPAPSSPSLLPFSPLLFLFFSPSPLLSLRSLPSLSLSLRLLIGCLSACGSCVLCVIEQRG